MKIWHKHLLNQLIKTFLLFLFGLFAVYVIVDLSAHGIRFLSKSSLADVGLYYLYTFSTLLDLFLSLAFLLATMKVLFSLNTHREIVALQMAGLSKKRLMIPCFFFAAILSLISYMNLEWLAPNAQDMTGTFKLSHKEKKRKKEEIYLHPVLLEDESELVYQSYDKNTHELVDVFWVRSPHDIWHMKRFQIDSLRGLYVDHLTRNSQKNFEKTESSSFREFPELPWNSQLAFAHSLPFENRPLSLLLSQAHVDSANRAPLLSHLYYKLLTPLLPFLILFTLAPICMKFSRNLPLFLMIAALIFGLIGLKIVFDGMLILGENQVLPASVAIMGPFATALFFSLRSFWRMK